LFLALCLTAGLAYLIRPTLLAYGTATVLTASIYTYQKRRNLKLVLTGFLFFGLGCCVNLIFNYYRFGNPFEFGYSTNFSAIPVVDYSLRFGYPFQHEPLWTASKELINALFFNLSYRSPTFRFREGAFAVFDIFYLAVLVLGIFLLPFFLLPKKSKQLYDRAGLIGLTLCWGLISFGILFAFYLHFPSLAGRYLSDFSMALNALFMSLVLASLLLFSSKNRLKNGLLGLGFLVLLSGAFYFCNKEDLVFFRAYQKGGVDTFSMNRSEFIGLQNSFHWQMMRNIHLPYRLDCHHEPVAQQVGWHMSGDCSVEASTTIFLPASRCLTVNYSVSQPDVVLDVRVKRNFTFLKLTGTREFKDHPGPFYPLATEVEEKFCSQASPAYSTALYTIGWVPVADLKEGAYPVVLHSVKVSN
ncbi:MAG: hypothetical protein KGJ11_04325, partial [Candidatus Omnitrophica bacterium]|nr:hypothetical protein [Candidatus Omnitrophota bacterium]